MSLWMCQSCHSLQGFSQSMKCFACEGPLEFATLGEAALRAPAVPPDLAELMNEGRWQEAALLLVEKVDALYKELDAARAAGEAWRPIDIAPKDHAEVLLYCHRAVIGWWAYESQPDPAEGWDGYPARWEDEGGFPIDPTHWMPLPDPPTVAGDGERKAEA